ncbi:MAG: bifunctional phosphoribosylaminoimidazolecarboxamide formyltransferase/IMP cyclohydrolase [Proteobacteria bacterium]|nr:bifunctional phosphoribosylaminoimidazolecarboxamide formyltransferase/IMP cyclohydrolase [Pseudomonadota bacterium]
MARIERALLSVSDKSGLVDFARALRRRGVELISSGGTAALLRQHEVPVTAVSDYTGAPEVLDGRVKTLHPKIFGGILARATAEHDRQCAEHGMARIDLVVVNLYPFEQTVARAETTLAEAIEQIDIGGPSLIRAAAKNHERVAVVVDAEDYVPLLAELDASDGEVGALLRQRLATRAFGYTAAYDAAISNYLQRATAPEPGWPEVLSVQLRRAQALRYGENPHQAAAFYLPASAIDPRPVLPYQQLQGKELSYNNLLDADAAWSLAAELPRCGVCIVKHTNPCGAATAAPGAVAEAFQRALATDPASAFGGIVGCNEAVDEALALQLNELFLEAVIAPAFSDEALALLGKKKKVRLLRARARSAAGPAAGRWRSALGGLLLQDDDQALESLAAAAQRSQRAASAQQLADLQLGWVIAKHVKSNAIVLVKDGQLLGVGAGQMSRVDSVELAVHKARLPLEGCALASDAFFPFRDGIDRAAAAGVAAVVQPGGSLRDEEVIAAANEHGLVLLCTGVRHFRH